MEVSQDILNRQRVNVIKKELFRKVIHLGAAFIPLALSYEYYPVIALLFFMMILYTLFEFMRRRGMKIPLISIITELASRKRDENHFVLGPVTLCCGILFTAVLFDPLPAKIGIWALAFGDGLASLVGKIFGKKKIPHAYGKTCAGSLACFFAIFISSLIASKHIGLAIFLSCVGTFIELLPLKDFDNLIIPVFIASIVQVFLYGI